MLTCITTASINDVKNLEAPNDWENKLVSFVITTKNEEAYLESCLKSIKNQTYKNIEIIVVDSCSEDRTVEIAKKYADKVIVKECIMPIGRNIGAKLSKGEILVFLDADTMLKDDWVEKIVSRLKHPVVAVYGDLYPEKRSLKSMILYWYLDVSNAFLRAIGLCTIGKGGTAIAVLKEAFRRAKGYTTEFTPCEDSDFSRRLARIGKLKFERKARGFFSLRFFEKYGYLNRLWGWVLDDYHYWITHKASAREYPR